MSRVDRRTFLKHVGAVSAASAAGAVTPFALAGMETRGDALPIWKKAPCRLCGVGCGLLIGIESGKAVAVRGDPESAVGRGLACAKGYYSVRALYGADRLTRATVRRGGSRVEVPMREALDLVARTLKDTIDRHGKDSVAMYGSAQWSITDAYVAGKLFKGALGTNNIDTSARLHSGSAMSGLAASFGIDGAVGSYADIEHADVFVLWDVNLAETDPVLFSRMLERRRRDPAVRIVELATRLSRTSYAADQALLHTAHTAPVIANAIAREIVTRNWVNRDFVDRYVAFRAGRTSPGYGLTTDDLVADGGTEASWRDYVKLLADYEPERAESLSGLSAASIRFVASLYGDPQRKVMSVWGHEVNADARGTWLNNLITNIHLLVGKVASPGNGPFVTTGQPSGGCAVHDAGSLAGTLPAGRVDDEAARRRAAAIWGVPSNRIDARPGAHALSLFRRVERGDIRFLWIMATDPMVSLPNVERYRRAAARGGCFLVVSEAYPTPTTDLADVVLPSAMWLERAGVYGNAERRLQHFERVAEPHGEASADAWQMIEVAHRLGFKALFDYAPDRYVDQIWEEYARFHTGPATSLPSLTTLRGRAGAQWPFANGDGTQWRYNTSLDSAADKKRGAFDFYGHADHRAWIWLRPAEPAAESTDRAFPLWLTTGAVLEQWGTGTMTQRIPTLHRAVPRAYVELNRDDAAALGVANREMVRVVSRRGVVELEARIDYRSQPARGHAFAPWFDEGRPVNRLTLDAFCPISGQPGGGACAVRIERMQQRSGA